MISEMGEINKMPAMWFLILSKQARLKNWASHRRNFKL
jgi:hypothetical protein